MNLINIKAINFKPNIRILENYIIIFENDRLHLFNFSGDELDKIMLFLYINDICIVNNIFFIALSSNKIYGIKINNEQMESEILFESQDKIKNTIYLKNNRLLVVSCSAKVILFDIENINSLPNQIIYTNSNNLYNFNRNIFISYTDKNMQLYEIRKGEKYYQLLNVYKFKKIEQLIKLNNNLLLVLKNNNLYTININSMKTNKIYLLLCHDKYKIKFICNDKHYLYLYINNFIYSIQYFQNQFQLIKSIELDEPLIAINCLCYLQINNNNILIKCEKMK